MRLVKDNSPGGHAVRVLCCERSTMFTLAEGYADLDGEAFVAYYCPTCVQPYLQVADPPPVEDGTH